RRRHTISKRDWSSDVCSSDLLFLISSSVKSLTSIVFWCALFSNQSGVISLLIRCLFFNGTALFDLFLVWMRFSGMNVISIFSILRPFFALILLIFKSANELANSLTIGLSTFLSISVIRYDFGTSKRDLKSSNEKIT